MSETLAPERRQAIVERLSSRVMCCPLCGATRREPGDNTLKIASTVKWGRRKVVFGRNMAGWFVALYRRATVTYCPKHQPAACRVHAARQFGFDLPEVLR